MWDKHGRDIEHAVIRQYALDKYGHDTRSVKEKYMNEDNSDEFPRIFMLMDSLPEPISWQDWRFDISSIPPTALLLKEISDSSMHAGKWKQANKMMGMKDKKNFHWTNCFWNTVLETQHKQVLCSLSFTTTKTIL